MLSNDVDWFVIKKIKSDYWLIIQPIIGFDGCFKSDYWLSFLQLDGLIGFDWSE